MASQSGNPYAGLSEKALEECIRRMSRTLTRKPRNKKTRAYLATLTGKPETPAELRARAWAAVREAAKATAVEVVRRATAASDAAPKERKDRLSPAARMKWAPPSSTKNCRTAQRQRWDFAPGIKRVPRDMETVRALKATLARAQGHLCALCGHALPEKTYQATIDHMIPRSMGGADTLGNFVAAHSACNSEKANDVPTGCEMVWLLLVNAKLGLHPTVF